jgi:hypothetical protein
VVADVGLSSSFLCFGVLSFSPVFLFSPINSVLVSLQRLRGGVGGGGLGS